LLKKQATARLACMQAVGYVMQPYNN